ncbi:MAG TPA: branched-chain amino acid ABC transporter permease [Candidatus Limnocylindria bacterium]|nr:branched-chain amino acid ABC transporter permease [Candidatus Limnocylindria bacterium]
MSVEEIATVKSEAPEGRERKLVIGVIVIGLALALPFIDSALRLNLGTKLIPIGIFIILALGLNVVVGFAGLLDLGYAAFFAIGAYTVAFLTSPSSELLRALGAPPIDFWLAMVVATAVAAAFGVILGAPTLRLRGDYLAIVTLGFGEIVPLVIRNTPQWTRGVQGMNPIGTPTVPGVQFGVATEPWYFLVVAIVVLSVVLTARLRDSRVGRAWAAIREDEVAAASMGVNPVSTKLFAFAMGASFSGFAGAVWSSYLQFIDPGQFDFSVSIFVLVMIILGGLGNIYGVIAGGIILGSFDRILADTISDVLQTIGDATNIELLRQADVNRARSLILGLALVILMLVRPEGLFPSARRKMELHAAEESEVEAAQQRSTLYETQR